MTAETIIGGKLNEKNHRPPDGGRMWIFGAGRGGRVGSRSGQGVLLRPIELCYGRAPQNSAWVTVMGNVNAVAVAVLADTACIVLAENAPLDGEARSGPTDRECLYWDPLIQFSIPGF